MEEYRRRCAEYGALIAKYQQRLISHKGKQQHQKASKAPKAPMQPKVPGPVRFVSNSAPVMDMMDELVPAISARYRIVFRAKCEHNVDWELYSSLLDWRPIAQHAEVLLTSALALLSHLALPAP